jgi:hypothetical protein
LVAAVRDVSGKLVGVHRTYIRGDGSGKADVEPAKASLGPIWGGAVRLASLEQVIEAGELIIAEGIESAASAGLWLKPPRPAWAAVSSGNLGHGIVLPASIRRVIIAADRDAVGQDAARASWFRLRREGRTVRIAMPHEGHGDFNDLLLGCREKPA